MQQHSAHGGTEDQATGYEAQLAECSTRMTHGTILCEWSLGLGFQRVVGRAMLPSRAPPWPPAKTVACPVGAIRPVVNARNCVGVFGVDLIFLSPLSRSLTSVVNKPA